MSNPNAKGRPLGSKNKPIGPEANELLMLPCFRPIEESKARVNIVYGGSASGKSHYLQQYLIKFALQNPNNKSLAVMESLPGLKTGIFYPLMKMLKSLKIPFKSRQTSPITITFDNGHEIYFISADESEKLKNITNPALVIVDEATSLTAEDYFQLDNRLGRTGDNAKIILSFNPISENHWLIKKYVAPFLRGEQIPNTYVHHSTYKDNIYLNKDTRDRLEALINTDENNYRIYCLGQPGVLSGLIYIEGKNWYIKRKHDWPVDVQNRRPDVIGLDFGTTHASAAIALWLNGGVVYAEQMFYRTGETRTDLMNNLKMTFENNDWPLELIEIKADAAEPGTIEDFRRAGFRMLAPKKSLIEGIDNVKKYPIFVNPESTELIREFRSYIWVKDKDNDFKDVPINKNDDAMAALRYGLTSMWSDKPDEVITIQSDGKNAVETDIKKKRNPTNYGTKYNPIFKSTKPRDYNKPAYKSPFSRSWR